MSKNRKKAAPAVAWLVAGPALILIGLTIRANSSEPLGWGLVLIGAVVLVGGIRAAIYENRGEPCRVCGTRGKLTSDKCEHCYWLAQREAGVFPTFLSCKIAGAGRIGFAEMFGDLGPRRALRGATIRIKDAMMTLHCQDAYGMDFKLLEFPVSSVRKVTYRTLDSADVKSAEIGPCIGWGVGVGIGCAGLTFVRIAKTDTQPVDAGKFLPIAVGSVVVGACAGLMWGLAKGAFKTNPEVMEFTIFDASSGRFSFRVKPSMKEAVICLVESFGLAATSQDSNAADGTTQRSS